MDHAIRKVGLREPCGFARDLTHRCSAARTSGLSEPVIMSGTVTGITVVQKGYVTGPFAYQLLVALEFVS